MLSAISALVLVMVWVERFLLVSPSLFPEATRLPLGPIELAITLGFVGVAGLCYGPVAALFVEALPEPDLDERGRPIEGSRETHEHEHEHEHDDEQEGGDA